MWAHPLPLSFPEASSTDHAQKEGPFPDRVQPACAEQPLLQGGTEAPGAPVHPLISGSKEGLLEPLSCQMLPGAALCGAPCQRWVNEFPLQFFLMHLWSSALRSCKGC